MTQLSAVISSEDPVETLRYLTEVYRQASEKAKFVLDEAEIKKEIEKREKNYEYVGRIGNGSSAQVYRFRNRFSHQEFALKITLNKKRDLIENEVYNLMAFTNSRRLEHFPVIQDVWTFNVDGIEYLGLKMDNISGLTLSNCLIDLIKDKVRLYALQLAEILETLDELQLVHNDINLENLIENKDMHETETLMLIDFGIMLGFKQFESYKLRLPRYNRRVGPPSQYDYNPDIFSFAHILYMLLAKENIYYPGKLTDFSEREKEIIQDRKNYEFYSKNGIDINEEYLHKINRCKEAYDPLLAELIRQCMTNQKVAVADIKKQLLQVGW